MSQVTSLIEKKKVGQELTKEDIDFLVKGFTAGEIPDYQMSAFLMSVFFQGMTPQETASLTDAMLYSGDVLEGLPKNCVDKHSTGGIGDKASFVLAPIAHAAGVMVPMIAGRGLGHTGGTIDKIECLKGFKTELSLTAFKQQLLDFGMVLMGQTPEIAPADKKIYALRDVTATVNSIPLITASIMSKKLAEGAQGLVFDIKFGSGAFMKTPKEAELLARSLLSTAKRFKRSAVACLTNMNQPLGEMVGHVVEIKECVEVLQGRGPIDLRELSLQLAAHMIHLAKKEKTFKLAYKKATSLLDQGYAYQSWLRLIERQGGNPLDVEKPQRLLAAPQSTTLKSPRKGYLQNYDNAAFGNFLIELGGGRRRKEDLIDLSVGLKVLKKPGMSVEKGEDFLEIFHHSSQQKKVDDWCQQFFKNHAKISTVKPKSQPLILKTLHS
jgi:pyrimidine-nucleoside phosphorylase